MASFSTMISLLRLLFVCFALAGRCGLVPESPDCAMRELQTYVTLNSLIQGSGAKLFSGILHYRRSGGTLLMLQAMG